MLLTPGCASTLSPPSVQAEACPAMHPYRPLLPQDVLVSHRDVLPGLRRFDAAGQLTTRMCGAVSTLASPVLAPGFSVALGGVQVALPLQLHNLLAALPGAEGAALPP